MPSSAAAPLGGHRDQCDHCGYQAIWFNSCRNRHCPKCQTNARQKWLRRRQRELLPVVYYHLVFSVPHALVPLMWQNKRILFALLFEATAATLLEVAANPKHLGARLDSSASCTPGDRLSNSTLTFTVSCLVVAFLHSTPIGSPHDPIS